MRCMNEQHTEKNHTHIFTQRRDEIHYTPLEFETQVLYQTRGFVIGNDVSIDNRRRFCKVRWTLSRIHQGWVCWRQYNALLLILLRLLRRRLQLLRTSRVSPVRNERIVQTGGGSLFCCKNSTRSCHMQLDGCSCCSCATTTTTMMMPSCYRCRRRAAACW
jgi:hypothetical protein